MNSGTSKPNYNASLLPADIEHLARAWDRALADRDISRLVELYAPDAVLESPLIIALLGKEDGICRGREEMRQFYEKVAKEVAEVSDKARPVHGDDPLIEGNKVVWENPRIGDDGTPSSTSSFAEVWVVQGGLIQGHRAYWGWDRMARAQALAAQREATAVAATTVASPDADAARIYELWDKYVRDRDLESLLGLYADDATIQSPLVQVFFGANKDILRGKYEVRLLLAEALRRRPDEEVRFHRTAFQWNGRTLFWEYPAEIPDARCQVDLAEVMDLEDGLIKHHRIYWGWYGVAMLRRSAASKTGRNDCDA